MFRGRYEHTIDAKGRTSLPSRFRDVLAARGDLRVVLVPWPFDACLRLYPIQVWEEYEAKIAALPEFDDTAINLRRFFVSPAVDCEVDKMGRILVPTPLRDHAHLTKDIVWAGMGRTVELWAKENQPEIQKLSDVAMADFRRGLQGTL